MYTLKFCLLLLFFNCKVITNFFDNMSNTFYITKHTLFILLKHTYTHNYYNTLKMLITKLSYCTHYTTYWYYLNRHLPTHSHATIYSICKHVHQHYNHHSTAHTCTPSLPKQPRAGTTYNRLYLLRLSQLLLAHPNHLIHYPKSFDLIFNE